MKDSAKANEEISRAKSAVAGQAAESGSKLNFGSSCARSELYLILCFVDGVWSRTSDHTPNDWQNLLSDNTQGAIQELGRDMSTLIRAGGLRGHASQIDPDSEEVIPTRNGLAAGGSIEARLAMVGMLAYYPVS